MPRSPRCLQWNSFLTSILHSRIREKNFLIASNKMKHSKHPTYGDYIFVKLEIDSGCINIFNLNLFVLRLGVLDY